MIDMTTSIHTANAMVVSLELFDGVGYNEQGFFAQYFMSIIVRDGELTTAVVNSYLEKLKELDADVHWLTKRSENEAKGLIKVVTEFRDNPTAENAEKVIAYSK